MITWPPAALKFRLQDLRDTATCLRTVPTSASDTTTVALARYLTVRSAGYVEAVRDDVADQYVALLNSADPVIRRVRQGLRTGQGCAPGQLLDFVNSFQPDWATELKSLLDSDDQRLKNSIGSLVAARKKIAHGDGENVTASRALRWAESAEEVGKWFIARFDPNLPTDRSTPVTTRLIPALAI